MMKHPPFDLSELRIGMSRDEVVSTFGEPDRKGGTSRKYRTPCVFRYGRIEFLFQPWKVGGLVLVQEVDEFGGHLRTLFPTPQSE
jgi:hypothetical protein